MTLLKGMGYVLAAAKGVPWFLKAGQTHPLDALGLVAAPIVFPLTVTVQLLVAK